MDRAMDLFKQMKRNKRVRPTIVTYNFADLWLGSTDATNGHGRERVMKELMNDPDLSPDDRTFSALIRSYSFVNHKVELGELSECTFGSARCVTFAFN